MTFRQFAYRNVTRNKRTYAAYFFSSAFSVMIFFVCALFIFNPNVKEGVIASIAVQAMMAAECIMYVFSFLFVLYSVSSFLKTRKREFGILIMHGMTKGQLNRMVFLENMIIGLGSIMTGILGGLLTGKLFLMVGSSFLGIPSMPLYVSWQVLALTVSSFVLLFLIISICTSVLTRTNKLIELFQAGQKPKSDPRSSVFLSILAAVLLIAAYYLAATATVATVYVRMLPVTAMTITGSYFFYTQLSVHMIKILKKRRPFFLRRTNIVMISSLAYRLKDNARMFFMVTVISTVSFCSVGVFTSINTLSKQFREDYPAAVGYLAKDGSRVEQQHLMEIREELSAKGIPYESFTLPIKYADAVSSTPGSTAKQLHLISFSDYRKAVNMAGFTFREQTLTGSQALVMIASQRDKAYLTERGMTEYTLKENNLVIREKGYTEHVAVPDYLLADLDEDLNITDFDEDIDGTFSGLVVSDQLFDLIAAPAKIDRYTGFYVHDFEQTMGIAGHLAKDGAVRYDMSKPYAITISGTLQEVQSGLYSIMLFVALLIGTVFFIAAGSFLYFRLYADLDYDRRQFATIAKIGLTDPELTKIVTRQLALLFFVPIGFAGVHSVFAFIALQKFFFLSIASEMGVVLVSFFIAQIFYFFFIRNRYLRNLKKALVNGGLR
ncbi:ABC transporter permease [Paenibacillus sp. sptzw28]|uniref:FtsX-like permease family protein n=1 Tax=Paenibacillus sp. sptzw28 TaxID=715179 RepID=UPI001C6EC09D|nr:ABC transporter permease [Paenibacillus sp. sptzw28]QYR19531.1 ABC transporter permease [Paenibacillus sp. sptzw28]